MTREEAIKRLKEARTTIQPYRYVDEAIDYAIDALEQEPYICDTCKHKDKEWDEEPCDGCCGNHSGYEPSGDLISRQAVDEIKELMTDINGDTVYAVRMSYLRQLPSVNPQEPKTGHWIYSHNNLFGINIFKCSKCDWDGDAADYNYCPNCGARMESKE